jgi:protein ImuA
MGGLEQLLQRNVLWHGASVGAGVDAVASGFARLDAELPGGGWPRAGLIELLADAQGIGELALLLPAFARFTGEGKRVIWVGLPYLPYAPALAAAGLDPVNLLLVRPASRREALWATEQALRSGSCHALAAWLPKVRYPELQRLAVAAQASRAVACLFRPLAAACESSPACLRLALAPGRGDLIVHIFKRRGAPLDAPLHLPLDRPFHVVGRTALSRAGDGSASDARRLGLPIHA